MQIASDRRSEAGRPATVVNDGYLLAVDAGTTTVRAVLFDLGGAPMVEARCEPPVYHPQPTWAEIDADAHWRAVAAMIRQVLQRSGVPAGRVLGVGLSGLMHAMVPLGDAGNVLARAMLWMDQRCAPQAEWMVREHGAAIAAILGGAYVSTTPSAPKLRWLAEHEPDLVRRTAVFLCVKDFLRFRLTGIPATDPSDAGGTSLYDRCSGNWSPALLDIVGLSLAKMPPILDSAQVAGAVTEDASRETGLAVGTPVAVGGGDVECTLIGAGCRSTGRACLYLGTAAWFSMPRSRGKAFGVTATTGASLKWLVGLLGGGASGSSDEGYAELVSQAECVPRGAKGLLFLPHLMGERGPQPDPRAKGVFFGLTLTHSRPEMVRAVLEGCALHLRSILDQLAEQRAPELVAVGGVTRSVLWRGIIADVTGATLLLPRVVEAGALGAAILAGVGVGIFADVPDAVAKLVRIVGRREADAPNHAFYDQLYRVYLELEQRVAPLYGQLPVEG